MQRHFAESVCMSSSESDKRPHKQLFKSGSCIFTIHVSILQPTTIPTPAWQWACTATALASTLRFQLAFWISKRREIACPRKYRSTCILSVGHLCSLLVQLTSLRTRQECAMQIVVCHMCRKARQIGTCMACFGPSARGGQSP